MISDKMFDPPDEVCIEIIDASPDDVCDVCMRKAQFGVRKDPCPPYQPWHYLCKRHYAEYEYDLNGILG